MHSNPNTGITTIRTRNATRGAKRNSAPVTPVTETPVTPETTPETPVTVTPETPVTVAPEPAAIGRRLHRDAATVAAYRTNFGSESNRDAAYAAFFYLAGNASGEFTLRQAHDAGTGTGAKRSNPLYAGSAKATDAGAINRLRKAGYINPTNPDCTGFAFTDTGTHLARSTIAKMLPAEPVATEPVNPADPAE